VPALKIPKIGNSLGVVLPKEAVTLLVEASDMPLTPCFLILSLIESYLLQPPTL